MEYGKSNQSWRVGGNQGHHCYAMRRTLVSLAQEEEVFVVGFWTWDFQVFERGADNDGFDG